MLSNIKIKKENVSIHDNCKKHTENRRNDLSNVKNEIAALTNRKKCLSQTELSPYYTHQIISLIQQPKLN